MQRKRVSVIGDLVFDMDHVLSSAGECHEGGRKLVVGKSSMRLGAAGGVASMVSALGCDVLLVGIAHHGDVLTVKRMSGGMAFVLGTEQRTLSRERFWLNGERFGDRVDQGGRVALDPRDCCSLAARALAFAPDAVVVCDHAAGVITRDTMETLKQSGVPLFCDPHVDSDWSAFSGVECLCMNRSEAMAAVDAADPVEPKETIQKCDEAGLWWYRSGWWLAKKAEAMESDSHRLWFPSMARQVRDTLGAGDQFIATLACSRVNGMDWESSIFHANVAAGLQCERLGVVPVTLPEICDRMENLSDAELVGVK